MEIEIVERLVEAESNVKGTSLITLYLPSGGNIRLVRDHVNQELKTASNIKNKNVGKAVSEALRSVSYKLKTLSAIPDNGLVICAGQYTLPTAAEKRQYL